MDWFLYDRDFRLLKELNVILYLFCLAIGNMTQCMTLHDFPLIGLTINYELTKLYSQIYHTGVNTNKNR